jgi:AcrR family transcriptional regulator
MPAPRKPTAALRPKRAGKSTAKSAPASRPAKRAAAEDAAAPRTRNAAATREAILESACAAFARLGYDGAGVREIAAGAGVTGVLVNRYFGSKEQLFAEAVARNMATPVILAEANLRSPTIAADMTAALIAITRPGAEPLRGFQTMLRSAASESAAAIAREQIEQHHYKTLAGALSGELAPQRAAAFLALVAGVQLMRQMIGLTALADADPKALQKVLQPLLEQLLHGGGKAGANPRMIEQLVQQYLAGRSVAAGQTVQFGWFVFRIADAGPPPVVETPDFRNMASYTRDFSRVEDIFRAQQQMLRYREAAEEPCTLAHTAIVSKSYTPGHEDAFLMRTEAAKSHASGWYLGISGDPLDMNDAQSFTLKSLYELSIHDERLLPFWLLPVETAVVLKDGSVGDGA